MKRNGDKEKDDNFMKKFKYYKSNNPKPSLELVLTTQNNYFVEEINLYNKITEDDPRAEILGLISLKNWMVYRFKKHPGLILIRNPFTSLGQRYWIQKSLKDYPKKPNKTNIDIERYIDDWWAESNKNDKCDTKLQKKLRWTTLGYHHNWDTKIYAEENKNAFPDDLAELCDVFANYFGYKSFKAQAAIVNYYHMGSTLSAHTDHSEVNLEAPLFSFSFGQSAIFLIGGHDKATDPSAILLNSGDVIIMSKEARLCYHAVPKILPAPSQPWDCIEKLSYVNSGIKYKYLPKELNINETIEKIWDEFGKYIKESRININVRQVLKENQTNLNDVNNIL